MQHLSLYIRVLHDLVQKKWQNEFFQKVTFSEKCVQIQSKK